PRISYLLNFLLGRGFSENTKPSCFRFFYRYAKGIPACFRGASVKLTDEVEVQLIQPSAPRGEAESVPAPSPLAMIGPEFIVAIGDLLAKCQKTSPPHTNFGYRRLRNFTGNVPTPAGEETFEEWVEQAVQAVEEWEVADAVKRQRLIESLRGPASDVIRNLKRDKPGCTAAEYLEALQENFGGVEDCAELIHKFSHTYQKEGEELSTYVWRLDKIIHQVILKRGMEPSRASKALMDQVFKGALPLDPIMLKFQTRYQNTRLTYSKLIKAIREEEALIQAKKVANASHTVFTAEVGTLSVADAANIQTEVLALKTQMLQMMELMMSLLAEDTRTEGVAVASNRGSPRELQEGNMSTLPRKKCFGCGEIGHFRA
uniref:Paraneoplastic antigen Ma-like C-terminal domain-containing protein n=1 Tax=Leptobrachium leishanense TaxID=445787 RepID=A0A8C5MAD7_9ANUR